MTENLDDPNLRITLLPDAKESPYAIGDDIKLMFTFRDFAQYAYLGYISIVGSNGKVFTPLANSVIKAPDLYLWHPLTFNGK